MRVIDQLIQHFCERGTLSTRDLDYLHARGFFTNDDDYHARRTEAEAREGKLDAQPDLLVETEDKLDEPEPPRTKRGGRRKARPKALEIPALTARLREHFSARLPCSALNDMATRIGDSSGWPAAAITLAECSDLLFRAQLNKLLDERPEALAELWHWVDVEPMFELLKARSHGRVARDLRLLLESAPDVPPQSVLGLLKEEEIGSLWRLLQLRARLISGISDLRAQPHRLTRCLAVRGEPDWLSWKTFCWAMVVLFNAQQRRSEAVPTAPELRPVGYELSSDLQQSYPWGVFSNGWSLAWRVDADEVRRLLAHVYQAEPPRELSKAEADGWPVTTIVCPFAWKIPCLTESSPHP